LLVFPPGEYYMDKQWRFTGFDKFGIVGNDATIVSAPYEDFDDQGHGVYRLFRFGTVKSPGGRLLVDGFTVDQTADGAGARVIDTVVTDELVVRDIDIQGQANMGCAGTARFAVSDPSGTGIVERFNAPDGAAWIQDTPRDGTDPKDRGDTGIISNYYNRGELLFKDCVLGAYPSCGLYASDGSGQIRVEGGRYANSNVAQIRLGGTDSYVDGATVVVDDSRDRDVAQRGIRLEDGNNLRVLNTDIQITSPAPNNHAISVQNSCESSWIQDTQITIEGDRANHGIVASDQCGEMTIYRSGIDYDTSGGYPIWLRGGSNRTNVQDLTITDSAGTDYGYRDAIRCEQSNAEFRAVTINQLNDTDRNGLVDTGDDTLVYKCDFRVHQFPLVEVGTGAHIEGFTGESHSGEPAVQLYDESADVLLKQSTLYNGIQDLGCEGLRTWGNTYP